MWRFTKKCGDATSQPAPPREAQHCTTRVSLPDAGRAVVSVAGTRCPATPAHFRSGAEISPSRSVDNASMPKSKSDRRAPQPLPARVVPAVTTPAGGLRRVEQIMGTAISLDVRGASVSPAALDRAFDYLRDVDRRFSTYKPESEVSRLMRGEVDEASCSPEALIRPGPFRRGGL